MNDSFKYAAEDIIDHLLKKYNIRFDDKESATLEIVNILHDNISIFDFDVDVE